MQIQTSLFGALLLSLSMHLGLIVAAGDGGRAATKPAQSSQALPTVVSFRVLITPTGPVQAIDSMPTDSQIRAGRVVAAKPVLEPYSLPTHETAQTPVLPLVMDLATPAERTPVEEVPALSLPGLAETHYFRTDELTEKPQLFPDTEPSQLVAVPDVFPQPVVVHLLINEQGSIDKVVMEESFLSESAKRFVIDSFAKTRFSPGKVGDLTVKSRLSLVVSLEGVLSAH